MARRPAQIPLDDEPVDIDLGDLPTDEELEAAAAAAAGAAGPDVGASTGGGAGYAEAEAGPLALFQLWVVLVFALYCVSGLAVGMVLAFRGAAQLGMSAFTHPGFYLVMLFWPITLWQLFWNQL